MAKCLNLDSRTGQCHLHGTCSRLRSLCGLHPAAHANGKTRIGQHVPGRKVPHPTNGPLLPPQIGANGLSDPCGTHNMLPITGPTRGTHGLRIKPAPVLRKKRSHDGPHNQATAILRTMGLLQVASPKKAQNTPIPSPRGTLDQGTAGGTTSARPRSIPAPTLRVAAK